MKKTSDSALTYMSPEKAVKPSRSLAHNQLTGYSNDGRLVQKAQQPNRKGNDGACDTPMGLTPQPSTKPIVAKTPPARA